MLFVIFYGLDWVATVPPTVALCRGIFGIERSAVVFGWVFAGHMIGAGVAAQVAGTIRQNAGSYSQAWWLAGVLCLVAAAGIWLIERPGLPPGARPKAPAPVAAGTTSADVDEDVDEDRETVGAS